MEIPIKTKKCGWVSGELVVWDGENDDFIIDFCAKKDHKLCNIASARYDNVEQRFFLRIEPSGTMRSTSFFIGMYDLVFCKRNSDVLEVFTDIQDLYENLE